MAEKSVNCTVQIYSFAYRYARHPVSGIKIPVFDGRVVLAHNPKEVKFHSMILNRPAVMICEFDDEEKAQWLWNLKQQVNANLN